MGIAEPAAASPPTGIVVGEVIVDGYVTIGWDASGEIIAGLRVDPPAPIGYDPDVAELSSDRVTLRRPDEADLVTEGRTSKPRPSYSSCR